MHEQLQLSKVPHLKEEWEAEKKANQFSLNARAHSSFDTCSDGDQEVPSLAVLGTITLLLSSSSRCCW